MQKWGIFVLGMISGAVLTFVFFFFMGLYIAGGESTDGSSTTSAQEQVVKPLHGMTLFDNPGDCFEGNTFEVKQVIDDHYALAKVVKNKKYKSYEFDSQWVLIKGEQNEYFYDGMEINVLQGKCMRQIGVYNYTNQIGLDKTVPVLELSEL